METLNKNVFVKDVSAGSGYDIQDKVFARLGGVSCAQFDSLTTSGQIRQFAVAYRDVLKPEEFQEFVSYANYIGSICGFQGEAEEPKQS